MNFSTHVHCTASDRVKRGRETDALLINYAADARYSQVLNMEYIKEAAEKPCDVCPGVWVSAITVLHVV